MEQKLQSQNLVQHRDELVSTHHWQPLTDCPSTDAVPRTGTFLSNGSLKSVSFLCSREGLCLLFPETAFMKDNNDLHGTKSTSLLTLFLFPCLSPSFSHSCLYLPPSLPFVQPELLNLGPVMWQMSVQLELHSHPTLSVPTILLSHVLFCLFII